MVYVWLAALVLFVILEASTYALLFIWFAAGALAGGITALLGGEIWLQAAVFVVVSGVVLAALRPLIRKYQKKHKVPTNADAVIGAVAVVTEEINNDLGKGEVSVQGKRWSARSVSDSVIPKDARVKAVRIEGVKLFVTPAETAAEV